MLNSPFYLFTVLLYLPLSSSLLSDFLGSSLFPPFFSLCSSRTFLSFFILSSFLLSSFSSLHSSILFLPYFLSPLSRFVSLITPLSIPFPLSSLYIEQCRPRKGLDNSLFRLSRIFPHIRKVSTLNSCTVWRRPPHHNVDYA